MPSWSQDTDAVLASHNVTLAKGLSSTQVEKLRAEYGSNELEQEEGTPLWKLVLQQFDDLLVKILLAAAVIDFVLAASSGESWAAALVEPSVIVLILVANG